jgi:NTE family protein
MRSILQRKDSVGLNDFRNAYYRIIEDDQIESIFPRAKYNPSSGMYNLYLKVKKEKRFKARIGGNVSSGNLNMVHLGIEHKVLGRNSLSLYANSYFGRYYSSLLANVRARFYTESPFYTDFSVFANQYDFYKSSFDLFYNEEHPPYLIQREMAARMMLVFPSGHTGKMELGMTGGKISDNYYNASFFLMTDTADKSVFTFFSPFLRLFYINTNFIQFPTRGKKTSLTLRFTDFAEDFQPGSLSGGVRKKQNDIYAFDFSLLSERYINISKYFKTGYLFHLHLSQRPFMSNYYSSLVTSPAYEPFPLAGTLFLEEFRAPQFVGAGARFLVCFSDRFHARMEGHYFQPYRKILSDSNGQPYYGEALANYSVAAQAALVYQAPFGPISLTGCYFSDHSREFYLVFNIGYLIYNRRAIDW